MSRPYSGGGGFLPQPPQFVIDDLGSNVVDDLGNQVVP
jgi:hypothetical protein